MKDFGGHENYYLRIPRAKTERSFRQSKAWVDEAIKINGLNSDTYTSATHISNHLIVYYQDSVLSALEKNGMSLAKPMSTIQYVAMLSALGITGKKEKEMAKYLRHHLGNNFCPSQKNVASLAEGHAQVFTCQKQWRYNGKEKIDRAAG